MASKSTDSMKADQDRVRKLLSETVIMLCKSGLRFEDQLEIKGVIAITIDKKDVFIVHIDDREARTEVNEIKGETGQSSPCTTSDYDSQYFNGVPAKKMKVEDTSNFQEYALNTPTKNNPHMRTVSAQGVSAPQFFTDDIDNQTPLKTMSRPNPAVQEPMKDSNQWALALPTPRAQAPMQAINNMMGAQMMGRPRAMMQQRPPIRQNMAQPTRAMHPNMPRGSGMRMMRQPNPNQQFAVQQQVAVQGLPTSQVRPPRGARGGRGSGRGRGRAAARMAQMEMESVNRHGRQKKAGVGRRPRQADESYGEEDAMEDGVGGYGEEEFNDYLM